MKIGLLIEPGDPPAWVADAISRLLDVKGIYITLVLEAEPRIVRGNLAERLGAHLIRGSEALQPRPRPGLPGATVRRPHEWSAERSSRDDEIAELDLVIAFANSDRTSALAEGRPSLEVWSYSRLPELQVIAASAAGSPVVQHALRRTSTPSAVLFSGVVKTEPHSPTETLSRLLFAAARWPAQLCTRRIRGFEEAAASSDFGPPTRMRIATVARAVQRSFSAWIRAKFRGLLVHEQWSIGVLRADLSEFLERPYPGPVEWMPEPDASLFIADPFGFEEGGTLTIWAEEYDRGTRYGTLREITYDGNGYQLRRRLLDAPPHRSYPFTIEANGSRWCIPESADALDVALYAAEPQGLARRSGLIEGRNLVDASVFRYAGRWWMWAADREIDEWGALVLFHAPELTGPWEEHASSPVKLDVRSARPAGQPFISDGVLYRPAQDCSHTYGGRITINRVDQLTPEEYQEEPVAVVAPLPGPYSAGLHTMSQAGRYVLVDGKRWARNSPGAVLQRVRSRLPGRL